MPVFPFSLEVLDIFGKGFQEAEIEPVGRPDSVFLEFDVDNMHSIHGGVLFRCHEWQVDVPLRLLVAAVGCGWCVN